MKTIDQWTKLNSLIIHLRISLLSVSAVCLLLVLLVFVLVNQEAVVIGLTDNEKLFYSGKRGSIEVDESDLVPFVKKFVSLRYTWDAKSPGVVIQNIAPYVTPGLLEKIQGQYEKSKIFIRKQKISQDVIIRKIEVHDETIEADLDRILVIGGKVKVVNPLKITLQIIKTTANRWNRIGLFVNGLSEHEGNK